jgi:hypothetical protein
MRKNMIGDTFVVVIDEVCEVTFSHEVLQAGVAHISEHETVERALAAVVELIEVAELFLGVCAASFELHKAKDLLLRDFDGLRRRLVEQSEFSRSARQG